MLYMDLLGLYIYMGHYKKNTHFSVITQLKDKYQPN